MLSPRTRSASTLDSIVFAQSETCSPAAEFTKCVKGYEKIRLSSEESAFKAVKGSIPDFSTYVYCQNDPNYIGRAAVAVWINLSGLSDYNGNTYKCHVQMGIKKERKGGEFNPPTSQVYVEYSAGLVNVGVDSSDPTEYHIAEVDNPSADNAMQIITECVSGEKAGTPEFKLDGSDVTPSGVNTTLLAKIAEMVPSVVRAGVELHDVRSHVPGTSSSKYTVTDLKFKRCGGVFWKDLGDDTFSGGTCSSVYTNNPDDESLEVWDSRN